LDAADPAAAQSADQGRRRAGIVALAPNMVATVVVGAITSGAPVSSRA